MDRHTETAAAPAASETLEFALERALYALVHDAAFTGVDVLTRQVRRHGRGYELEIMVDRNGEAVDLALCERVASFLNDALEARPEHYTLQVESPGIDRPLLRPQDYEAAAGKLVKIVTTLPIGNAKTHRGTLVALRGTNVLLAGEAGEFPIPLDLIRSANLEYDYRADLKRAKEQRRNDKRKTRS